MHAISGLMSVVRYCPNCDSHEVVNYWVHSGVRDDTGKRVVRYQCSKCSTQTTDLTKMDMSAEEYVNLMSGWLGNDVTTVGDSTYVRDRDGRVRDLHKH